MNNKHGTLYLVPTPIAPEAIDTLSQRSIDLLTSCTYFITERIRTTRRLLKSIDRTIDIDTIHFIEMDKHNSTNYKESLSPLLEGYDMIIVSEAGMPCLADPGEHYVSAAHDLNIKVQALSGPCSILQALVGSGFNAEQFSFHGYLPRDQQQLKKHLSSMHSDTEKRGTSHIWIETPYRNEQMIKAAGQCLPPHTRLCVAVDLDLDSEDIRVQSLKKWNAEKLSDWHKRPAIFILGK